MPKPALFQPPFTLDKKVKLGIIVYLLCMSLVAMVANGTADEGDSISHYLFAKMAWKYPQHFFDHWAKPVYVLITFPFAQFGLVGVKFMNLLLNGASLWITYKTATYLKFRWPWLPPLLLTSIPMYNYLSLGGLTEPMCACLLITGIYLLLKEKWIAGVVLLSFLPFVRSEGLLMLGVVFIFLICRSRYEFLPLLATGHVVYSIAGYFYYHDLLWVFNKMTYATWGSAYGKGSWTHFVSNLDEILGAAQMILFWFALLFGVVLLIRFARKQLSSTEVTEFILVYGSIVAYFLAHTAFWALGIFNSGGILRVMVAIMPLFALANYRGLEYMFAFLPNATVRKLTMLLVAIAAAIYPFTSHEFAYKWQRDFQLKADQFAQKEMGKWLQKHYPYFRNHTFYYETVYISDLLNIDWFDTNKRKRLLDSFIKNEFEQGDFLIWDDWFAVTEAHITLESLLKDQRLQRLASFERKNYWGTTRTTVLFRWVGDKP